MVRKCESCGKIATKRLERVSTVNGAETGRTTIGYYCEACAKKKKSREGWKEFFGTVFFMFICGVIYWFNHAVSGG